MEARIPIMALMCLFDLLTSYRLLADRGVSAIVNDSLVGMSERPFRVNRLPFIVSFSFNLGRLRRWLALLTVFVPISAA